MWQGPAQLAQVAVQEYQLYLLAPVVFVTAAFSAVVGMGGGVTLLAVMAAVLPAQLVVPLHGVVQLVSNSARTLVYLPSVNKRIFVAYAPTAIVGVLIGAHWYMGSPLPWFRPVVGFFILAFLATRYYQPRIASIPIWGFSILGGVTGLLASLIGATGPLLAPFFLRDDLEKEEVVATKAAVQLTTHAAKLPAFLALGFAYGSYAMPLLALCIAAILGTVVGKRYLANLDPIVFRRLFITVLTLVALNLILGS